MVSELVDGADILYTRVLILVVVEDGLRVEDNVVLGGNSWDCLNPCCCGRWSQS